MSVMTHESKWRLLVGAAPLIGVAFFIWAAAQGEGDVARSPTARAILAVVAALGAAVAWWTARQLRVAAALPISRVAALAQDGQLADVVALRGRARALPEAVPLVSPDGELCLWFRAGDRAPQRDSVRPFLLADDSGECIVLPAGADVTGLGPLPAAPARRGRDSGGKAARVPECLLRNGDCIHVTGRFVAASPESLVLQAQAASLVGRAEAPASPVHGGELRPSRDLRSAALAGAPYAAAAPAPQGLLLPVIAAPGAGQPLQMRIVLEEGEGGVYGVLAVVDCLVLLVSSSLMAWSMFVPH
jgi:hypothetical protein